MKEIVKDVCSICNQPFKRSAIKIKLLHETVPTRRIKDCHP